MSSKYAEYLFLFADILLFIDRTIPSRTTVSANRISEQNIFVLLTILNDFKMLY